MRLRTLDRPRQWPRSWCGGSRLVCTTQGIPPRPSRFPGTGIPTRHVITTTKFGATPRDPGARRELDRRLSVGAASPHVPASRGKRSQHRPESSCMLARFLIRRRRNVPRTPSSSQEHLAHHQCSSDYGMGPRNNLATPSATTHVLHGPHPAAHEASPRCRRRCLAPASCDA